MDNKVSTSIALLALTLSSAAFAQTEPTTTPEDVSNSALPTLVINGQEVANLRPVATYETPISSLEFDPRIDLQSRNMAEAQGDIFIGFGLMQLAGLAFAYGQVAYRDWKRKHKHINHRDCFALLTIGGTLCAATFSLIFTDWGVIEVSPAQWQALLYLGCIASGLGFFLWNKGAARSNPGTLAAFNNAVVPLAVICSLFIFGEITSSNAETLVRLTIGAALIASAVIVGQQKTQH